MVEHSRTSLPLIWGLASAPPGDEEYTAVTCFPSGTIEMMQSYRAPAKSEIDSQSRLQYMFESLTDFATTSSELPQTMTVPSEPYVVWNFASTSLFTSCICRRTDSGSLLRRFLAIWDHISYFSPTIIRAVKPHPKPHGSQANYEYDQLL
jgi:hypothetical protein